MEVCSVLFCICELVLDSRQTTITKVTKMVKVTIRIDLSKEQNNLLEHQMTLEGEKCKATFIRKSLFKNSLSDAQKIDRIFKELCGASVV
jgi:hypothetical protein